MRRYLLPAIIVIIIAACSIAAAEQFQHDYTLSDPADSNVTAGSQHKTIVYLQIFSILSGPALIFLLLNGISGGGFLPYDIENALVKMCAAIICITVFWWLHYITSSIIFVILIFLAITVTAYTFLRQALKKIYMKKFAKPTSPDIWICKKCGAENSTFIKECNECGRRNPDETEDASGDNMWRCDNCGYESPVGRKSCGRCGHRREGE
ncbi:MAG: hypothetical protein HQ558_06600 [Candidatus Omnitrophica bacterium]|nr:hypothetical protein [Candidatus Omnitrophota bacterium]